jgi:hypothetical protein
MNGLWERIQKDWNNQPLTHIMAGVTLLVGGLMYWVQGLTTISNLTPTFGSFAVLLLMSSFFAAFAVYFFRDI